jgi:molecular chaperone DnaK
MVNDNKSLGRFILDGIPPAPRGMPQVEVSFDIDANGILSVKAKDKTTGKEQSIKIEARSTLSKEEIEKMKKDAEANAAEDARKREAAEAKNLAEQLIYTAEKALRDTGEKVPTEMRKGIEDKIADLKTANNGTDSEKIKSATQALSSEVQKIGQYMQKQNEQPTTDSQPPKSGDGEQGNVRDAETK